MRTHTMSMSRCQCREREGLVVASQSARQRQFGHVFPITIWLTSPSKHVTTTVQTGRVAGQVMSPLLYIQFDMRIALSLRLWRGDRCCYGHAFVSMIFTWAHTAPMMVNTSEHQATIVAAWLMRRFSTSHIWRGPCSASVFIGTCEHHSVVTFCAIYI